MKSPKIKTLAALMLCIIAVCMTACEEDKPAAETTTQPVPATADRPAGKIFLEFDVRQDMELISLATFSEPPQLAIWLEDPQTHKLKTIYASYRSASGDMIGKAECPGCLPLWFAVYEHETGTEGLPTMDNPAPDAITEPTPLIEHFNIRREVAYGSKFILWMEMNLAGDFNANYTEADADKGDWDYSGQPPLVWRCEIEAVPGNKYVPELFGQVDMEKPYEQMIQPLSDKVTTAKKVFKSIEIRVIQAQ